MISPKTLLAFSIVPMAYRHRHTQRQPLITAFTPRTPNIKTLRSSPSSLLTNNPYHHANVYKPLFNHAKDIEPEPTPHYERLERKLSGTELFYYLAAKNHHGWGTSAICLRMRVTAPTKAQVQTALAKVQSTHDMLKQSIKETASPIFFLTDAYWVVEQNPKEIPFTLMPAVKDNTWKKMLNVLLQKPMPTDRAPLIQLILLHNQQEGTCDILMGFHHAITDGAGAWHLLRAFAQYCWPEAHTQAPECASLQQQNVPRQHHPYEAGFKPEAWQLADMLLKTLATGSRLLLSQALCQKAPEVQTLPLLTNQPPPLITLERRLLEPETLTQLIKINRENHCNLHASLTAIALCACQSLFKKIGPTTPICYNVPVNLRDRLAPWPTHQLGVRAFSIGMLAFLPAPEQTDFWALAKTCKNKLNQELSSQTPQATYLLIEHTLRAHMNEKFILAQIPKDQVLINNLGRVPTPSIYQNCSYQALSWSTQMSDSYTGIQGPLVQFYVATINDRLSISVQSSRLYPEQVSEIADGAIQLIHELLKSG